MDDDYTRRSNLDTEKLKASLMQDLSDTKERAKKTSMALGVAEEPSDFVPRAVRIAGKATGQAEIRRSQRQLERLVKDLAANSGLTDEVELGKFQSDMTKKLQQARLMIMKQTGEFKLKLAKMKIDQRQKQAAMNLWTKIGTMAVGAALGAGIGIATGGVGTGLAIGLGAGGGLGNALTTDPGEDIDDSLDDPEGLAVSKNLANEVDIA